jgi:uncharacterized protein (DUF58 family)
MPESADQLRSRLIHLDNALATHSDTTPSADVTPSGFVVSDLMMLLLMILASVGVFQERAVLATFGALVLVVALLSRVWARLALRQVHYSCETSTSRALEGDNLWLILTLENRKPVPVPWVLVREQIPVGLQLVDGQPSSLGLFRTSSLATTTSIGAYQRVRLRFRIKALRRGHYVLGPGRLTSGDPFGFYGSERIVARAMHTVIVYPSMWPLPQGGIELARPIGDALARARSVDDPTLPVAVREYTCGDSMRAMDWKVTARRGAPWVRVNASSVAGAVVLLLECETRERDVWDDSPQMLDRLVHTAASLARDLLARGHAVGLIANGVPPGDNARVALAPAAGRGQLNVLLDALARVQSIVIKSLPQLVREHASKAMPFGATVVGVSAVSSDAMLILLAERRAKGVSAVHIHVGDEPLPLRCGGDGFGDTDGDSGGHSGDHSGGHSDSHSHGRRAVVRLHWPRIDVPTTASASPR